VSSDKRGWLALLLGLTLIRGLIYLSVTPPWQSPDETGHFEYAWLIAHLGQLPTEDTLSPPFERELLSSLYEWRYGEYIGLTLPEQMPARLNELGKPVLVLRNKTERPEGVEAGAVQLVGPHYEPIVTWTRRLLDDPAAYQHMAHAVNPYGDGHAAERIVRALL
jgi:hypothetical protein